MIKLYDRIKELSYVIGTGNITLSGAMRGFSTFSSCYSNGDILFYAITDGTNYELGSGTYISSSNVIARFPVKTTNSNNLVNFAEGLKEVYVNYPATNAVFNTSGINPVPQNSGLAFWTSSNSLSYSSNFVIDSGRGRIGINKSNPAYTIDIGGTSSNSIIRSSGFLVGNSGIHFPSGNDGISSYSGGRQLVHFEPNQLSLQLSHVLELSGIVNQNIVLKKQNAGTVFAGPPSGCSPPCDPAYPNFRPLTLEDIPDLSSLYGNYNTALSGVLTSDIATVSGILNSKINSASGALNTRIDSFTGIVYAASGAVNSRITAASGYLDNKINNILLSSAPIIKNICNGRLSISSTNSVAEGTGTNLYFVPHNGDQIALYNTDTTSWQLINFSSKVVANTNLTPATYDVYGYLNNDDISFELISWVMYDPNWEENNGWNEESYRSTPITNVNGILCKNNDLKYKYIGTIHKPSNVFVDTTSKRLICNNYNKTTKIIKSVYNSNISWSYNTNIWRALPSLDSIDLIGFNNSILDISCIITCQFDGGQKTGYGISIFSLEETNTVDVFGYSPSDIDNYLFDGIVNYFDGFNISSKSIMNSDLIVGDYQDPIHKTLISRLRTGVDSMCRLWGIERALFGSPSVSVNNNGRYGLMGTYEC